MKGSRGAAGVAFACVYRKLMYAPPRHCCHRRTRAIAGVAGVRRKAGLPGPHPVCLPAFLVGEIAAGRKDATTISLEAIAAGIHSEPFAVRRAIDGLIQLGVLGVPRPADGRPRARFIWLCRRATPDQHQAAEQS